MASTSDLTRAACDFMESKGVPDNFPVLTPRLVCHDPEVAIDFYVNVFDATELNRRPGPDGRTAHSLLAIGSSMLMVETEWPTLPSRAPRPDGTSPVVLFLYVEDVDRTIERAVAHGARVLVPLQNQFWGDRIGWIMDPAGHVWTLATRIEEPTADERASRWANTLRQQRGES